MCVFKSFVKDVGKSEAKREPHIEAIDLVLEIDLYLEV